MSLTIHVCSTAELLASIRNKETLDAMVAACPPLRPMLAPETWFKAFMMLPTNSAGEVTFTGFRKFCERVGVSAKETDSDVERRRKGRKKLEPPGPTFTVSREQRRFSVTRAGNDV